MLTDIELSVNEHIETNKWLIYSMTALAFLNLFMIIVLILKIQSVMQF